MSSSALESMSVSEKLARLSKNSEYLSQDQIGKMMDLLGLGDSKEVVIQQLDPSHSGRVKTEALLSWLNPSLPSEAETARASDHPKEQGSPTHYKAEDVEKFRGIIELKSCLEDSFDEYKTMAEQLANDIKSRGRNPQAEAFIEQVCVESILNGCLFVGHVKTDLDSVAGAIGAAALWSGVATRAEREYNGEITFALDFAGLEAPPYFDDVPGAITPRPDGSLMNVCLVDHNEEKQMVESLRKDPERSQRICGVIDHHCLSQSFASSVPVYMDIRPWGSMSSIVAHSFIRSNRPLPKPIARILLTAILSDTLNLQSVTTTTADKMMVTLLSILGEVADTTEVAQQMFRAKTEWIVNLGPYEMTRGDQKDFTCNSWKVGIAVLEVTDPTPVLEVAEKLILELRILKIEKGDLSDGHDRRKELDFAFLFVVDVTQQRSVLLVAGHRELLLAQAAFPHGELRAAKPGIRGPGSFCKSDQTLMDVGSIVSRKAEFVPSFFKVLSGNFECHKLPMSNISEELAFQTPEDEHFKACQNVRRSCFHNSICVVRDYSSLEQVLHGQSKQI